MNFPNSLTLLRIFIVPVLIVVLLTRSPNVELWGFTMHFEFWGVLILLVAAATDWADGYLARRNAQVTTLGILLDPIADKLLVSACLLMLAAGDTIHGWALLAAIIILCREILVSGLREYLAELRVSVPVTRLAKWKTTGQMVAVGFLVAGDAGDQLVPVVSQVGILLLWLSALLTLYTGYDYMRAGLRYMMDD